MAPSQLHELDALAQAAAVRSGELSPVELVEHHLDRVQRYGDQLGAFITVTADRALEQARLAEKRLLRDGAGGLPPLFGVPTAVKDNVGTADTPTSFGSKAFEGFVPPRDGHLVTLLREAGTISLGKTNTPEFAASPYTDNDLAGPSYTPWDPTRTAGGSSGGAAAAVAAGLVPFAHGNDGGGSIRIPASACGVFGLKPARGRISNGPFGNDATGFTTQGPLARTVRDAAAMLDAMAGPMPGDPHWAPPLPPGETFLQHCDRDPGRLRVAAYCDPYLTDRPVDPEILAAYRDTIGLLTGLGHEVEEIANPFGDRMKQAFVTVWGVQQLILPVPEEREELLRPLTRMWRAEAKAYTAPDFLAALQTIQLQSRLVVESLQSYDAVLTPTLGMLPPRPGWFQELGPERDRERQTDFSPFTAAYNATGQPAAGLPLHMSADGLPIGMMLAGRPAGEAQLLSLCAQIEAARPWADRRPPLFP